MIIVMGKKKYMYVTFIRLYKIVIRLEYKYKE